MAAWQCKMNLIHWIRKGVVNEVESVDVAFSGVAESQCQAVVAEDL